jgi:hypothetical protein
MSCNVLASSAHSYLIFSFISSFCSIAPAQPNKAGPSTAGGFNSGEIGTKITKTRQPDDDAKERARLELQEFLRLQVPVSDFPDSCFYIDFYFLF